MFTLGIKKLLENALHPTHDALNLDYRLLCCEDTVVPAHSTGLLKTGLEVRVPSETYVRVIPDVYHRALSGPVVNKSDGETLDVLMFNASSEDVTIKRGNPIARILLVARADVKIIEEDIITPLEHSDTFKYLNDIISHVIGDVSDELRQWCLAQHKDTARIRSGESRCVTSEITHWMVHGFDDNGRTLWHNTVPVKMPYNAWTSSITPETPMKWFFTHDREILYVEPYDTQTLTECTTITNVLRRLSKRLLISNEPKKQRCIAIGGRDISKATAMAIDAYINFNNAFANLRNLPLYYVNLDDTAQCILAIYILAKCDQTDVEYDACIFDEET